MQAVSLHTGMTVPGASKFVRVHTEDRPSADALVQFARDNNAVTTGGKFLIHFSGYTGYGQYSAEEIEGRTGTKLTDAPAVEVAQAA